MNFLAWTWNPTTERYETKTVFGFLGQAFQITVGVDKSLKVIYVSYAKFGDPVEVRAQLAVNATNWDDMGKSAKEFVHKVVDEQVQHIKGMLDSMFI